MGWQVRQIDTDREFIVVANAVKLVIRQEVLQCITDSHLDELLEQLCFVNSKQWVLEDRIREPGLADCEIACLKKQIDLSNLERLRLVNRIDSHFLTTEIKPARPSIAKPYLNSESLGQLLDSICILNLKKYYIERFLKHSVASSNSEEQKGSREALLALKDQYEFLRVVFWEFRRRLQAGTAAMGPPPQVKFYGKQIKHWK